MRKYKAKFIEVRKEDCRELKIIPSFPRYAVDADGSIYSLNYKNSGKMVRLKPAISKRGYLATVLLGEDSRYHTVQIHRCVCEAFNGIREYPQFEVNHINGIKTDNRKENLEYCSHSDNILHAFRCGLAMPLRDEDNPKNKLSNAQVAEIRAFVNEAKASGKRYYGRKELARKYGVSEATIKELANGKVGRYSRGYQKYQVELGR